VKIFTLAAFLNKRKFYHSFETLDIYSKTLWVYIHMIFARAAVLLSYRSDLHNMRPARASSIVENVAQFGPQVSNCRSRLFSTLHGPCRRLRDDQNGEDTRTSAKSSYTTQLRALHTQQQHNNCPSSAFDDRRGRDLFRVLKRSPISRKHALGLRRSCSDGKTRGNTTGLRRRLHPL